jgi:hypothetical protein
VFDGSTALIQHYYGYQDDLNITNIWDNLNSANDEDYGYSATNEPAFVVLSHTPSESVAATTDRMLNIGRQSNHAVGAMVRRLAEECVIFFDARQANAADVHDTDPGAAAFFELDELSWSQPLLALAICDEILRLDRSGFARDSIQVGMLVHILNSLSVKDIESALKLVNGSAALRSAVDNVWVPKLNSSGLEILEQVRRLR